MYKLLLSALSAITLAVSFIFPHIIQTVTPQAAPTTVISNSEAPALDSEVNHIEKGSDVSESDTTSTSTVAESSSRSTAGAVVSSVTESATTTLLESTTSTSTASSSVSTVGSSTSTLPDLTQIIATTTELSTLDVVTPVTSTSSTVVTPSVTAPTTKPRTCVLPNLITFDNYAEYQKCVLMSFTPITTTLPTNPLPTATTTVPLISTPTSTSTASFVPTQSVVATPVSAVNTSVFTPRTLRSTQVVSANSILPYRTLTNGINITPGSGIFDASYTDTRPAVNVDYAISLATVTFDDSTNTRISVKNASTGVLAGEILLDQNGLIKQDFLGCTYRDGSNNTLLPAFPNIPLNVANDYSTNYYFDVVRTCPGESPRSLHIGAAVLEDSSSLKTIMNIYENGNRIEQIAYIFEYRYFPDLQRNFRYVYTSYEKTFDRILRYAD